MKALGKGLVTAVTLPTLITLTPVAPLACNGNYFHVEDFAGLYGGNFGLLTPITGNHSLWCGVRASQSSYAGDGYGNDWNECWESCEFAIDPADSLILVMYSICYQTQPGMTFSILTISTGPTGLQPRPTTVVLSASSRTSWFLLLREARSASASGSSPTTGAPMRTATGIPMERR